MKAVDTGKIPTALLGGVLAASLRSGSVPESGWRQLVERLANGEASALHALYERTHRAAFTLLMRMTCSREIAEDLTLELYGELRKHAARFRAAESMVLAWVMNRARSLAIARLRRDQSGSRGEPASHRSLIAIEMPDYRNILKLREQGEAMREALATLDAEERRALETVYFGGLSYEEAAARFDRPVAEVEARAREALSKLERRFAPGSVPFCAWPTDILRPGDSLRERLAGHEAGKGDAAWIEPEWKSVAPGITCKVLADDPERHMVSMLVRLDPGAEYPPHTHAAVEELHLLDGELWIDDRKLYAGDYYVAQAGTSDHRVWSQTGCTCVLTTSTRDSLL
jgi:RNA polymerase sigma-70 factor (ECF subfamily)